MALGTLVLKKRLILINLKWWHLCGRLMFLCLIRKFMVTIRLTRVDRVMSLGLMILSRLVNTLNNRRVMWLLWIVVCTLTMSSCRFLRIRVPPLLVARVLVFLFRLICRKFMLKFLVSLFRRIIFCIKWCRSPQITRFVSFGRWRSIRRKPCSRLTLVKIIWCRLRSILLMTICRYPTNRNGTLIRRLIRLNLRSRNVSRKRMVVLMWWATVILANRRIGYRATCCRSCRILLLVYRALRCVTARRWWVTLRWIRLLLVYGTCIIVCVRLIAWCRNNCRRNLFCRKIRPMLLISSVNRVIWRRFGRWFWCLALNTCSMRPWLVRCYCGRLRKLGLRRRLILIRVGWLVRVLMKPVKTRHLCRPLVMLICRLNKWTGNCRWMVSAVGNRRVIAVGWPLTLFWSPRLVWRVLLCGLGNVLGNRSKGRKYVNVVIVRRNGCCPVMRRRCRGRLRLIVLASVVTVLRLSVDLVNVVVCRSKNWRCVRRYWWSLWLLRCLIVIRQLVNRCRNMSLCRKKLFWPCVVC